MPSHTYEVHTSKPAEAVFDYLIDLRHAMEWLPSLDGVQRINAAPDAPVEVGSRFAVTSHVLSSDAAAEYELIEVARPGRIVWRVHHRTFKDASDAYTLTEAADGGTDVSLLSAMEMAGMQKIVSPLAHLALNAMDGSVSTNLERALAGA